MLLSTPYKALSSSVNPAYFIIWEAPSIQIPDLKSIIYDNNFAGIAATGASAFVYITRNTGGTIYFDTDFIQHLFRPVLKIASSTLSYGTDGITVEGSDVMDYVVSSLSVSMSDLRVTGDVIEFTPGLYNTLVSVIGDNRASAGVAIDLTATYKIYITPRWSLL